MEILKRKPVNKYKLTYHESFAHQFTKKLIFNGLKSKEIRGFYFEEYDNCIQIYDKFMVKMEYPFFKDFEVKACSVCRNEICESCFYIPDTYIQCISDITILNNNGKPSIVIEIVHKKELSDKKKGIYKSLNLQVIIIRTEDILKLTKLYPNLRVHQIIERDSNIE